MNQPPLNPDALEAACAGFYNDPMGLTMWERLCTTDPALAEKYRAGMKVAVSAYLAAALPEVTSVPGVYDLGSPEPAGVDQVVECDEFGEPDERGDSANDPTWSKTTDGTRWKGYKDGKEYRTWADLVRRYGPLTEYRPEVKP